MYDLAHVTDLHLLEADHKRRSGSPQRRLQYLSAGRRLDAEARLQHAVTSLREAGRLARHIVVTGDLTEDGVSAQFEVLAEALATARVDPQAVTLVPGNHDRYDEPDAFEQALAGSLAPYRSTSTFGQAIEITRHARLMPICTAVAQSYFRSAGRLSAEDAAHIDDFARQAKRVGELALVAQHHQPQGSSNPAWNWIDGLINATAGVSLLNTHAHLQVLHGHTHFKESHVFAKRRLAQVHSAAAVVSNPLNVRYYQITREALVPVERTSVSAAPARAAVALA